MEDTYSYNDGDMEKVLEKKQPDMEVEECGSSAAEGMGALSKMNWAFRYVARAQGYVLYEADGRPLFWSVFQQCFSKPYNGSGL